jgi:hypothetical protein
MNRLKRIGFLSLALTGVIFADRDWDDWGHHRYAPEIDAGAAVTGLALVSSAMLIIRSRRRKP